MIQFADIQKQVQTLELAESFFTSAVLFALYDLGVFRQLADGPQSLDALHHSIGGNRESLRGVLDAAVALKLLRVSDDGYFVRNDALLDCLGRAASPAYLGEWIAFLHGLTQPLFALATVVRTGQPSDALRALEQGEGSGLMTRAMDAYARTRGLELVDRIDFSRFGSMLDLGCGPGTYGFEIARRFPNTKVTLLDLETPIAIARTFARRNGLEDRVEFIVADALNYQSEVRYDAILVSNTLHMLGTEASIDLLRRCWRLLRPGGTILVQAQYLHDSRTFPRWATLLNLIQRCVTPHGRNHAVGETAEWLRTAGFIDLKHMPFAVWNVNGCMLAKRPRDVSE